MIPNDLKKIRIRTVVVAVIFILMLGGIAVRASYLQVMKGPWLTEKAVDQIESPQRLPGKRGKILDANGKALAISVAATSIAADPRQMSGSGIRKLARAVGMDRNELRRRMNPKRTFVWIKRQVTPKEVLRVKGLKIPGIVLVPEHSRYYPGKTMAAQVLGFSGIDGRGLERREYICEPFLRGKERTFKVYRDAKGRGFDIEMPPSPDHQGKDIILTIDSAIQYITEKALGEAVRKHSAKAGSAIVMNPTTGEILGLAHHPLFNPNAFADYKREAWRNKAVTDTFEPGSTMKIFSAAAALESGIATPNTIYYCENGVYRIGKRTIRDTKPHGWLSLQQIVKYSSNIGSIKVAETMGSERLYNYLAAFGFGQRTGIRFPGESKGSLAPPRRWTTVDTGSISYGYGISVSTLQLATAAAAIANDGVLMKPYIIKAIASPDGDVIRDFVPQPVRRVVSTATARTIRRIMGTVITSGGTGENAAIAEYNVCGKTGTAHKIDPQGGYSDDRYVASFIGFAPADDPQLVILVVVDEPKGRHYGGNVAAPAFAKIAHETLNFLGVSPSKKTPKLRVSIDLEAKG
jgi:cell division protein FtsI (penicillin-binding protein 3)